MILSDSSLFGWLFWAIFWGGGFFCAVSNFFFLSFFLLTSYYRGQREGLAEGKGHGITRIPTNSAIFCWFTHSGVVGSISETQNACGSWECVHWAIHALFLHRFPWICFTDVSRPWIGSRSVWRLGLTVLIDIMSVRTPGCNYGGPPRRRVFPGARVASQTDYQNPQFGAPNQM